MKTFAWILPVMLFCTGALCQVAPDMEKEKEAVIAVIKAETQSYCDRDFEAFAATWKQDESVLDVRISKTAYGITFGWEGTGATMEEFFKNNPEPIENMEVKKNFKVQVKDNFAWATFDQDSYNGEGEIVFSAFGTNILEKIDGNWRIVHLTRLNRSSYYDDFKEIQLPVEVLNKLAGKYEIQPGFILTVFTEGDRLMGQATGQPAFEFFAMAEDRFFIKDFYTQIEFNSENGKVVGLTLTQGQVTEAKKIE